MMPAPGTRVGHQADGSGLRVRPRRRSGGTHVGGIRDRRDALTPQRRRVVRTDRRRRLQCALLILDRDGWLAANHLVVHSRERIRHRTGLTPGLGDLRSARRAPERRLCDEITVARSGTIYGDTSSVCRPPEPRWHVQRRYGYAFGDTPALLGMSDSRRSASRPPPRQWLSVNTAGGRTTPALQHRGPGRWLATRRDRRDRLARCPRVAPSSVPRCAARVRR